MKNWRMIIPALLVAAFLLPAPAPAGDEEWADAGKILAGVVGLYTVQQLWSYRQDAGANRYDTRYGDYRGEPRQAYNWREPQQVYMQPATVVVADQGHLDYATPRSQTRYVAVSQAQAANNNDSDRQALLEARIETKFAEERLKLAEDRIRLAEERAALAERRQDRDHQAAPANWQSAQPDRPQQPAEAVEAARMREADGGLVLQITDERRLWQPARKGADAYLQVYSDIEQKWVNLKTYPSFY